MLCGLDCLNFHKSTLCFASFHAGLHEKVKKKTNKIKWNYVNKRKKKLKNETLIGAKHYDNTRCLLRSRTVTPHSTEHRFPRSWDLDKNEKWFEIYTYRADFDFTDNKRLKSISKKKKIEFAIAECARIRERVRTDDRSINYTNKHGISSNWILLRKIPI